MRKKGGPQKPQPILHYAVKLLAARPYSEKKLSEKLRARNYSAEEIGEAIHRLKETGLLDDNRYAEEFAQARLKAMPRAAPMLIRDLLMRGISFATARDIADRECGGSKEIQLARELVKRKIDRYRSLDETTRLRRLSSLLARRGFKPDTIRAVLEAEKD